MNKDQIEGTVEEQIGNVKQKVGHTFNDDDLEVNGAFQRTKGKVRKNIGNVKEDIADELDN
jgi:uncharacterized protein YjbJ (UPF0337 family)